MICLDAQPFSIVDDSGFSRLVHGGGAKAIQTFVSSNITAISVSVVILLPAWPCPFYTSVELCVNSVIPVSFIHLLFA